MKPSLLLLTLLVACAQLAGAGDLKLAWDPVTDPELAGYQLGYGSASGQYGTVINVGNVTEYTVSGLAPGAYYLAVKAYGIAGQQSSYSNEVSASIAADADTRPPEISGVGTTSVGQSAATIVWTTGELSDSQVEYGLTSSYGNSTVLNTTMAISHTQSLSRLIAGTTYHYRVKSADAAGNLAVSGDFSFTTSAPPDTTLPTISAVASGSLTSTGATITWTTNEASDTQVEYRTTTGYGSSTTLNSAMVTSHSQALSGLIGGTTYHYRVRSADAAGNQAVSGDYTFATTAIVDITTGLSAAYAFDEGAGSTSADLSGNGNSASIYYASWTAGKYGKALYFNGNNSYVSAGISGIPAVGHPKTISCWIYLTTTPRSIQSMLALANPALRAAVQYGHKRLQAGVLGFDDTWMVVTRPPSLRSWHHFGYVFDGSQNRLYIDGVLASTSTIALAVADVTNFQIGRRVGGSEYFKGSIDDVRIYNRALSLQELKAAMNMPVTSASAAQTAEASSAEETLLSDEEVQVSAAAAQPAANPVADLQLERETYMQGKTVGAGAFWISNPSNQSRDVEVKSWISLPGMLPISLDLSVADKLSLSPYFNEDYGAMPLLAISADAPSGTGEANARLIDPVTADLLSEDINPFTITSVKRSSSKTVPEVSSPYVVLEEFWADGRYQYLISNRGAAAVAVEFKAWLEASDGGTIPIFSVGAEGSLILQAGSDLTLDPLASAQIPAGSYILRARVLDAASGEILCETGAAF